MDRSDDVLMSSRNGLRICLARFLGVWGLGIAMMKGRDFVLLVNNTKLCERCCPEGT
jgi:hypothetical protein